MANIEEKQPIIEENPLPPPPPPPQKNGRNRILVIFTLGLVVLAVAWFFLWLFYLRFHETTDDAYANGNMITLNSAISGSVVAFYADDTDLVTEGQLLVQFDPTLYQVEFDKSLASLATTVLEVRKLYDTVNVYQATVENKRAALETASYDYLNRSRLVDSKAISNEDFVHAKDIFLIAQYDLAEAMSKLQVAIDEAGNTPLIQHPRIEEEKGSVRKSYYNLKHCCVYAPATGYVAQRFVDVGEWVAPNRAMMAVIPIDYVWVDANYKETQLAKMRVGQPAKVTFDLYGSSVVFEGKVLGIAFGTGSVFSLIPPQNATGNWIKIVQRLPVRISLDPEKIKHYPIRLGISANVDVNLTDQDLPMVAETPARKTVGITNVFDIQLEEVEKIINGVIEANLQFEGV